MFQVDNWNETDFGGALGVAVRIGHGSTVMERQLIGVDLLEDGLLPSLGSAGWEHFDLLRRLFAEERFDESKSRSEDIGRCVTTSTFHLKRHSISNGRCLVSLTYRWWRISAGGIPDNWLRSTGWFQWPLGCLQSSWWLDTRTETKLNLLGLWLIWRMLKFSQSKMVVVFIVFVVQVLQTWAFCSIRDRAYLKKSFFLTEFKRPFMSVLP